MKRYKLLWIVTVLLLAANPVFAETGKSGTFSIGAIGGWAGSVTSEAIEGYSETEFKSSGVYGGSIMYRFPSGFALELCAEHLAMDLEELGKNFGTLNMTPVLLLFKFQGMPKDEKGWAGHLDIGGGISFNSFDKGSYTTNLEKTYGVNYTIDTDESFVFEFGGGVDYFFTRNFSTSLDGRFLIGNVGTSWGASGPGGSAAIEDLDKFYASNFQLLLGLRYWFK